jgi:CubicO group peptidase (beta-lactamase class C family)
MATEQAAGATAERIGRIESAVLQEPIWRSRGAAPIPLADLMAQQGVPGVSVAVIHDGALEWARGYGVREAGQPDPVTPDTLFQVCSISKPVTAVAVLRLAQEGRLDLDEDVNRYLRSWSVPANGDWQPRVTLRQLLCHGAGMTVHGFPGYGADAPRPTLRQVLDGAPPANTPPVRVNAVPGTQFRYAGGGISIVQQVLMDVTGLPFAQLMRELVLDPLEMDHSTYEQPLPANRQDGAATGHRSEGAPVAGKWHVYPEQAAAGLWTTPADLARLAIDIQQAPAGAPGTLLRPDMVARMLTPQVEEHIGLGFFLEGQGLNQRFAHGGDNEGFKANFLAFSQRGEGVIVTTNGDLGWIVCDDLTRTVWREYSWPDFPGAPQVRVAFDAAQAAACAGRYELQPGYTLEVTLRDGALYLQPTGQPAFALQPRGAHEYFAEVVDVEAAFEVNDGQATKLIFKQNGKEMPAPRQEDATSG